MPLHGELAVSLLDLLDRRATLNAEHFVVIAFGHLRLAPRMPRERVGGPPPPPTRRAGPANATGLRHSSSTAETRLVSSSFLAR
jgi:hypothetical protein